MANMSLKKNPMPSQEPDVRNKNFDEVALGYTAEMAIDEAQRCLNCKNPKCVNGCPVNVHIPEFISKVAEGKFDEAFGVITSTNSLPAICGRVCPQENQCEGQCVRGIKGEPVGIGRLEHFGVKIMKDTVVGRTITVDELMEEQGFEAVFIGSGAGLPMFMDIPGVNYKGVLSANEFLTRINLMKAYLPDSDTPIIHPRKVAVVGGGNVAMDAARCAKRLGAEVYVVYRRGMEELPARKEEVEHAEEEGIIFKTLCNPVEILADENDDVKGIRCIRMELGEPDASGRRRPIEVPGSEFDVDVDCVIMALGTSPNPLIKSTTKGLEINKKGGIVVNEDGLTSRDHVYAGGDAVTGAATVILAMGAGKTAAKAIDEALSKT